MTLYWPKLLMMAYAITHTIEPLLPLYIYDQLEISPFPISVFISILYLSRLLNGVWSTLLDSRPHLYQYIVTLLSLSSSFSIGILLIPILGIQFDQDDTLWLYIITSLSFIFNGLFYQPLDNIISSIAIKVLGDYRILFYGSYVRYSQLATLFMAVNIGVCLYQFNISLPLVLLSVWIVGILSIVYITVIHMEVEPASSDQLDINEDQTPLLLKNRLTMTSTNGFTFPIYKPYSLFADQLSYISEEDTSQLDRMIAQDESLRLIASHGSAPSFYSRATNTPLMNINSQYQPSLRLNETLDDNMFSPSIPSNALVILPITKPTDPILAIYSWMKGELDDEDELIRSNYYYNQTSMMIKINKRRVGTISLTLFLLGFTQSLMNTFLFIYLTLILHIPLYAVPLYIGSRIMAELMMSYLMERWLTQNINLTLMTTLAHGLLITCSILYSSLKKNNWIHITLLGLQFAQGVASELLWLTGSDQVIKVTWSYTGRIKQRAILSALYSSISPCLGSLLAGYILYAGMTSDGYQLIFKISLALYSLSFLISWGWTGEE